ncbi:MAG: hypothetical protein ACE141_11260 [Bryobacteraceae bacterium]
MPSPGSRILLACILALAWSAEPSSLRTVGPDPGPWLQILGSVGFTAGDPDQTQIFIIRSGEHTAAVDWMSRVEAGAYLILEGESEIAKSFGFVSTAERVRVVSVEERRDPGLDIVWERPVETPVFRLPEEAAILARERTRGAPMVAGMRRGAGGVLWVAVSPGPRGYERFPGLLDALTTIGLRPPFRSSRLWAFFDTSYRSRADVDYLAERWIAAGIRGLHVAAWHYFEPDAARDAYLKGLIQACHRRGILVYAWLELPHVSEKFWADHPEWREQTALGADAHLDWRKLMNLANPDCAAAVATGIEGLLERFDWDGVNLAELYFESLQGHGNPSRFTPMNGDVRRLFRDKHGFDPRNLFDASSPEHLAKNPSGLRRFLDFRSGLARRIQKEWLARVESMRRLRPDLDIVLTNVDDRFDSGMRDAVGADAAALLPLLARRSFTFLVEDPATVWNLGPDRYHRIAAAYAALTPHRDRLAIDLNIVERYQDVYPTKQQAGTELMQLVSEAARAFPRVALYFENSIRPRDVAWLSSAAAAVLRCERQGEGLVVDSPHGAGIRWRGEALLDGRLWPAGDGEALWIPPGRHSIQPAKDRPCARLLDLTGELISAESVPGGIRFTYRSAARVYAVLDALPRRVRIDRRIMEPTVFTSTQRFTLRLPPGEHRIEIETRG